MHVMPLVVAAIAVMIAGPAFAQSGHGHGHQPGGRDDAQAHRRVEACLGEFDQVAADGRGVGLAFPADQNGYPGPMHAVELKDRLRLTPEQEARMRALFETMLAEARSRAARLTVAEARAEVRLVHLVTHVQARDVLTETQRRTYHQIRWGAAKNH